MSEEKKIVELNDEELAKVSGGYSKNPDGTYNLTLYESISSGNTNGNHYSFMIMNDYQNITLDDCVLVEYSVIYANGDCDYKVDECTLREIFVKTAKEGLSMQNYGI